MKGTPTVTSYFLAAPGDVQGISGGQILGSITYSGLALGAAIALVLGVRGSDRIKLNNRDKVGVFAIITGTLFVAAGGMWAQVAAGIGDGATSTLDGTNGIGDPGQGGISLALALCTFAPKWKKLVFPALFGLASAVTFHTAGGVWGIIVRLILVPAKFITGGA